MMHLSAITALFCIASTTQMYETTAFSLTPVVVTTPQLSRTVVLRATVATDDSAAAAKIMTGPDGKAALNYDDDLRLTLQIIMDHQRRSATVSTEQLVQQVTAAASIVEDDAAPAVDISVPYDAAAKLAYDKESSSIQASTPFAEYKVQYEAKAVADVIAKKIQSTPATPAAVAVATKSKDVASSSAAASSSSYDISIPYDAAAKLAYAALSTEERTKVDYTAFQLQYTERAVADVIAKQNPKKQASPTPAAVSVPAAVAITTTTDATNDIRIPYDAAARLAYSKLQSIKHSLTYEQFRLQYEQNAVSHVMVKKAKRDVPTV